MRFPPPVQELFNLIASDVGRPIGDITVKVDDPSLTSDAASVLGTLASAALDARAHDGCWFHRRLLPYRGHDGSVEGVVATYTEISELKTLQQSTLAARRYAESIVDTVRSPLLVLDADLLVVSTNRSYLQTLETTLDETVGLSLFVLQEGLWELPPLRRLFDRVLPDQRAVEEFEVIIDDVAGQRRVLMLNARQVVGDRDRRELILIAFEDVTEHSFLKDLRDGEAQLRAILEVAQEAIIVTDEVDTIVCFSAGAARLFGYRPAEIVGRTVGILLPESAETPRGGYMAKFLEKRGERVTDIGHELDISRKDGTIAPARLTVSELRISGRLKYMVILHDLSDDRRRQAALQSAQKLEAIGQLTGGVAHDFNNLLNVISGNLELLESQLDDLEQRELLDEAAAAAKVGASLTSRLLAFARRQPLEPRDVSLNVLIESLLPLLRRTLPDGLDIRTALATDLAWTRADPGQIESVLLNLALNASDAMPDASIRASTDATTNVNRLATDRPNDT